MKCVSRLRMLSSGSTLSATPTAVTGWCSRTTPSLSNYKMDLVSRVCSAVVGWAVKSVSLKCNWPKLTNGIKWEWSMNSTNRENFYHQSSARIGYATTAKVSYLTSRSWYKIMMCGRRAIQLQCRWTSRKAQSAGHPMAQLIRLSTINMYWTKQLSGCHTWVYGTNQRCPLSADDWSCMCWMSANLLR